MIDIILDRWATGESAGSIRKDLKLSRNRVPLIVLAARKRGDARAIHHHHANGQIIGRYHHRPAEAA